MPYCPILERKIVYIECLDCDEKLCKKQSYKSYKEMENSIKIIDEDKLKEGGKNENT